MWAGSTRPPVQQGGRVAPRIGSGGAVMHATVMLPSMDGLRAARRPNLQKNRPRTRDRGRFFHLQPGCFVGSYSVGWECVDVGAPDLAAPWADSLCCPQSRGAAPAHRCR